MLSDQLTTFLLRKNMLYFLCILISGILCVYALILVLICRAMISAGLKEDASNADVVVV